MHLDVLLQLMQMIHKNNKNVEFKNIIFDFDGTIADTLETSLATGNDLLEKLGKKPMTRKQAQALFNMTVADAIKRLGLRKWQLIFLAVSFRRRVRPQLKNAQLFDGVRNVLEELACRDFNLGIVSSNSSKGVKDFLIKHRISHCFNFVYGDSSYMNKQRTLKKCIGQQNLDNGKTLYIADEVRDIKASRKAGIYVAAVSWGLTRKHSLKQESPDFLLDKPKQITEVLLK